MNLQSFIQTSPNFVGIELTSSSIRLAVIRKEKRKTQGWKILHLQEIPFEDVKPLDNLQKSAIVTSAIDTREVLVRSLDIPLKTEKNLHAAIEFQMEPHLPYPIEKSVVMHTLLEKLSLGTRLTIQSVKKEHLQAHLAKLKSLHIEPEIVTSVPSALMHLASLLPFNEEPLLMVHIGEKEGTLCALEKGKIIAARSFALDKHEIQKALLAITSSFKHLRFDFLYLIGNSGPYAEMLQELSGKRVLFPPASRLNISTQELEHYGLAIGIALTGDVEKDNGFRQKEYAFPHPFRRLARPLVTYFALSALLFTSLFFLEKAVIAEKEKKVSFELAALLAQEGKEPQLISDVASMQERLSALEAEIDAKPDTFPMLPAVPRVKDFIAWLSAQKEAAPLNIDTLHYTLVRFPELGKTSDPYQVKIELEFSTPDPNAAHAFHQALLAPNAFVNPKPEVQWNPGKGKYRVTFFLKDKTRYS